MDDYRWFDFQGTRMEERYPSWNWLLGAREWVAGFQQGAPAFADPAAASAWLNSIRTAQPTRPRRRCPRVFVSHRQIDDAVARRLAWLACQERFDHWVDLIDLDPARNPQVKLMEGVLGRWLTAFELSVLTAGIIEMALLNCTHVLAAITANAAGSLWIPYQYGRAKDVFPMTTQAACWFDGTKVKRTDLAEYLHLGAVHVDERAIRRWLANELTRFPNCKIPPGQWPDDEPQPLPA